jgi:hypothetical protein
MNPASPSRSGGREPPAGVDEADSRTKKTPNTDLQPEDTGTPDSGVGGRGTASEGAMKQPGRTGRESQR